MTYQESVTSSARVVEPGGLVGRSLSRPSVLVVLPVFPVVSHGFPVKTVRKKRIQPRPMFLVEQEAMAVTKGIGREDKKK